MSFLTLNFPMGLALIAGFIVSFITIPPIVRISRKKKLVALPNGRTSHSGAIPALGGVAIFGATILGTSLFMTPDSLGEFRYILAALFIVFGIGLKDDLVNLSWSRKFIAEAIAALLVVVLADVRISTFHGMLGIGTLPLWFSIVFSVLVFLFLINAFNLLDGIDGLASGMGIFISLVFGIWLSTLGATNFSILAFSLAGGLIAFYGFNVFGKKHKLFMGDSGSLVLGFLFSVLSIKILCCEVAPSNPHYMLAFPTVIMSVMIIPMIDTIRVFTLRILRGQSPFHADRTHLHHIFLRLGFSHLQASLTIIAMNAALFALCYSLRDINALLLAVILFTLGLALSLIPCYIAQCAKVEKEAPHLEPVLKD